MADEGGRGGGGEESPGGGVTRKRRGRKWRQKKRDFAVKVGPCNVSLTRIFILLLFPPPPSHTGPCVCSLVQENRTAFCLDSPNSFNGTTEA